MSNSKKIAQNDNNYAIAYYRFSSHAQSDTSIQQQKEAAEKYAAEHGLRIIKEYKDEAISGTTENRPGFKLMLLEVARLKPSVLITWKTDRLGRERYHLIVAKKIIRDAGCSIRYIAEVNIDDTPEGALLEGLLDALAEYYSLQLRANVTRGHMLNATNALFNGQLILGYKAVPAPEFAKDRQRYAIDEKTAPIVRRIFEDYAAGRPMTDIARELNAHGFTTVRGKPFTSNSLAHTLRHRAYIGEYRYADVFIPNGMPAIIDKELFEAAQKRLIRNKRQGGQRAHGLEPDETPRFWLTGELYCGKCDTPMQGYSGTSHTQRKYYYYSCSNARKHKCSLKNIKKDKIEAIVCRMLASFLEDSENLTSLAVDVAAYYNKQYGDTSYIDSLKAKKKEDEKALNNFLDAIGRGIISDSVQARILELENNIKKYTAAIEVEEMKRAIAKNDVSIKHFFEYYKNSDFSDPAVRDYILEYFVDKIYVYDDEIVITGWYGSDKREVTWHDVDVAIKKGKRKSKKGSSACVSSPPNKNPNFDTKHIKVRVLTLYPENAVLAALLPCVGIKEKPGPGSLPGRV